MRRSSLSYAALLIGFALLAFVSSAAQEITEPTGTLNDIITPPPK